MITVRFGLQKHFPKSKNEDVINSDAFSSANEMTKAVLVKLSKEGLGTVRHKEVILPEDLQKLYNHQNFSCDTPKSLQKGCSSSICLTFVIGEEKTFEMLTNMILNCVEMIRAGNMYQ